MSGSGGGVGVVPGGEEVAGAGGEVSVAVGLIGGAAPAACTSAAVANEVAAGENGDGGAVGAVLEGVAGGRRSSSRRPSQSARSCWNGSSSGEGGETSVMSDAGGACGWGERACEKG